MNELTFNFTVILLIIHYRLLAAPDIGSYVSSLPCNAHSYLDFQLDIGHKGVEKDLHEIAYHMPDWEEKLSTHLELTPVEISDINKMYPFEPVLQR